MGGYAVARPTGEPDGTNPAPSATIITSLANHPDYEYANTCRGEGYMGAVERDVVRLINLARINAPLFISEVLLTHRPDTNHPAVASLIADLRLGRSLEPLKPMNALYKSATSHAQDLGYHGTITSSSSNQQPYYDRIHQFLPGASRYAEVLTAGPETSVDIALSLLLDAQDPGANSRKVLLSNKLQWVGCSVRPHKSECVITILDMVSPPVQRRSAMPEIQMDSQPKKESYGWNHCPPGTKVAAPKKVDKRPKTSTQGSNKGWWRIF